MQKIIYPEKKEWKIICKRPAIEISSLEVSVSNILKEVKENGDEAVKRFTLMFDKVSLAGIEVSASEISESLMQVSDELKTAIQQAKTNIEKFHTRQTNDECVETMPGVRCWSKSLPIEKIGLYIPGGTAPLFSTLLMLAVPARLAGCKEIILCSPANKEKNSSGHFVYGAFNRNNEDL